LKKFSFLIAACALATLLASAPASADPAACSVPRPIIAALVSDFEATAQSIQDKSLFTPKMMWAAIVDRRGILCTITKVGDAWPGSRQIAIAKASSANDFSNDKLALSTANLYGATIPQGSLFGLNTSNTFNPVANDPRIPAVGSVPGGIITFGGGVPLYLGSTVIGGLGVSGDTACADHDVAYVTRQMAIGQHIVSAPVTNDNIVYENPVVPGHFTSPYCLGGEVPPAAHAGPTVIQRH
jgi:uncharacterized protein GlcG (DUF336 family)